MYDPLKGPARRCALRQLGLATAALALACALTPSAARAQRAVDVQIGRWTVSGPDPTLYSIGLWRSVWGPFGYTLRGLALIDADSSSRSLYGAGPELSLLRGAGRLVPYAVAGAGLALAPGTSELVAVWNAGLGLEWNPLAWFGMALEVNRYAEDPGFRGFWGLQPDDRSAWVVSGRVAVRWGLGSRARPGHGRTAANLPRLEPREPPAAGPYATGLEGEALALSERVVETALAAMGEPYRWGGTSSEEGFDCSGLVWYAYATHGVSLPRMSRDQARVGRAVAPEIGSLAPGDILLFANRGSAVTHVGLYVGNGRFIHATNSGGVRVGALDGAGDANDRWWVERWVGARRVLR